MKKIEKKIKILFIASPLRGHANMLGALAEEMISRGYDCSFAIEKTGIEWFSHIKGLKLYEIKSTPLYQRLPNVWDVISNFSGPNAAIKGVRYLNSYLIKYISEEDYECLYPILDEVKPDMVIPEFSSFIAMEVCKQRKIPYIEASFTIFTRVPGLKYQPILQSSRPRYLNFFRRMANKKDLLSIVFTVLFSGSLSKIIRIRKKLNLPLSFSPLDEKSMCIVTSTFGLELARPIPPLVHIVGPILPVSIPPLSPELSHWIDSRKNDIIYISMGTLSVINEDFIKKIIYALGNIDASILWSIPANQSEPFKDIIPSNFRLEKYVSQLEVLAHEKVKLFITHYGLNSVMESLYFAKPIIGYPFFIDHYYWAARTNELGCGLSMDKKNFTAKELKQKVEYILKENYSSFKKEAEKMSIIAHTAGGRKRAADIIEMNVKCGTNVFQIQPTHDRKINRGNPKKIKLFSHEKGKSSLL